MDYGETSHPAFGAPGNDPFWSPGAKDAVGTAYSSSSCLWYTIHNGIVTEIYYPTVDRPGTRDVQLLFSNGETIFTEPEIETSIEVVGDSLGYLVKGRTALFAYEKEILSDPHLPCLLHSVKVDASAEVLKTLKAYILCAPHLAVSGRGNNAQVAQFMGGEVLVAEKQDVWLAMAADTRLEKASVGYVGSSDGWTDLQQHKRLEWQFDAAPDGNVALIGEISLSERQTFNFGVAFGGSKHQALSTLVHSLSIDYSRQRETFLDQWSRTTKGVEPLGEKSGDGGALFSTSVKVLLAHEDKRNPGAIVGSLGIPWGEVKGDSEGEGGYHLVWTRDMVQSAMGLMAAGKRETPLRALIYLAASQRDDGGFPQNFWVNGIPFWTGIQVDEVAFPILLGHRLWKESALEHFQGIYLLFRAVRFLIKNGPITDQERWEETSGLSPSTLAVVIAALICASFAARHHDHAEEAEFLEQYADWMERNIERWTVTKEGTLVPGISTHYVRIAPARAGDAPPVDGVTNEEIELSSSAPGASNRFQAKDIVDAGFLQLVRYGIRAPDDPIIVDSVKVVDAILKEETASGVSWHRYNHDGYGQRDDGSAYQQWGKGRLWPLLTGERGHYELAAGRSAEEHIRAMESLATATHLLPEQSWDAADQGEMKNGRPTGSAAPLAWAHAEYIKLLRSARDGKVYDLIPEVEQRYLRDRLKGPVVEFWLSFRCPVRKVPAGCTLRVLAEAGFKLHFSLDGWASFQEQDSRPNALDVFYTDVQVPENFGGACEFTFYWQEAGVCENRNFRVEV